MSQAKLRMVITLQASQLYGDLADPCYAEETVDLTVPYMEPKQLDLSKVLQGATEAVITRHREALRKAQAAADAEKKRQQEQRSFWMLNHRPDEPDEPADMEDRPSDVSVTGTIGDVPISLPLSDPA